MFGVLNSQQIEELLNRQIIGRLGCSIDGNTYIVPISYAYDGNYIYCHTHEGKKTDIMRQNPKVSFLVEDIRDMANWKSVIVTGFYEELEEQEERSSAIRILLNRDLPIISSRTVHLGEHWPFSPDDVSEIEGIVFKIAIRDKSGRFESEEASPSMPG